MYCSSDGWDCDLNDGVVTWDYCWALVMVKDLVEHIIQLDQMEMDLIWEIIPLDASGKHRGLLKNCIAADNYGIGITENNSGYPQIKMDIFNCVVLKE